VGNRRSALGSCECNGGLTSCLHPAPAIPQTNAVALPGGGGSFTGSATAAANEVDGGKSRTNARINGRLFNLPAWFPRTQQP
jgi:hypothetical protein